MEKTADEVKRLQSCINDLISVLALAAIWSGSESCQMLGTLLDSLLAILRLDFACARLNDSIDGSPVEVVRLAQRQHPSAQPQEVGRALGRWLSGDKTASRFVIPNPAGEGEVAIASFSLGLQDEVGVLVAGSRRADFPTDIERLLLRVAANQAAIGLQEARRSGDQKRVAEVLETRVAERTSKLTAVNEELRRSQAYLAEAQRLSHTGSFGWRVSNGEIIWSEETFRIFQYDRTTIPTVELILQRVQPDDAALVRQTIQRASQDGKDFEHEFRLVMPDSAVKHVHVVARAERDESGELEFVGAVMDTTKSKRVEKKLRRSEESLLEAQKLSHTGSWRHEVASGAVTVSPEVCRIHDIKPDDDPSNTEFFFSKFHPEDRKRVVDLFEKAEIQKTDFQVDYRIVLSDGTIKYLHTTGHPILDESGHLVEFVGTAMDVTAAKQAEEALRRSEAYLAEAQRLSHTGSWATGAMRAGPTYLPATGEIRYWSEECYRVLGFDPHGEQPQFETFSQRIHPDDQARVREIADTARREKAEFEMDYRIVHPGGEIRDIHTVGHPVLSPSGDLVEFVGTVIDITERKRAEEERERLRQTQADLARVNRVTTMGELTASLAHEVNQPLAAGLTNAKTCLRWLSRDVPDLVEARAAAMRIVKDQTRAAEIVSRIRLLFKKGTPQRELVDVNEVIREMIVLVGGETTQYSVTVLTELAADLPPVMGDRVQLQQVLMNLMTNGIEAMRDVDGTRELAIKSRRAKNEELVVCVTDTGVGLPAQRAEQIFNAFFTTKPHGTGMGLRISRSIVESHGGRLWAENNSPRGASFHFTLSSKGETHE
jgi:PAS domain S-box-containing protein